MYLNWFYASWELPVHMIWRLRSLISAEPLRSGPRWPQNEKCSSERQVSPLQTWPREGLCNPSNYDQCSCLQELLFPPIINSLRFDFHTPELTEFLKALANKTSLQVLQCASQRVWNWTRLREPLLEPSQGFGKGGRNKRKITCAFFLAGCLIMQFIIRFIYFHSP